MANTYLTRTFSSNGNRKTFTISVWIKSTAISAARSIFHGDTGSNTNGEHDDFYFTSNDTIAFGGWNSNYIYTLPKYRDTNAWYHAVLSVDTTQSTEANRVKFYINNVEQSRTQGAGYPAQNFDTAFIKAGTFEIAGNSAASGYGNYVLSHYHFVDGTALTPSTFGSTDSTTGEWKINTSPTVSSYGTNGFFILKDGNSGTDQSPNSNNFTVGGGTLTKTEDNPSNVFATLNPLTNDGGGAKTYSFGNTKVAETANSWTTAHSTLGATSGKWYFEAKVTYTNAAEAYIGASSEQAIFDKLTATHYLGETTGSVGYYTGNGYYYKGAGGVSYGSSVSSGAILGCALDLDNNFIYFSINGTWQNSGDPTSGSSGTNGISLPSGMTDNKHKFLSVSPNESYLECNFGNGYFGTTAVSSAGTNASGNGIFEYDVPTGYTALSTKGLNL